jgi:hypothetical protein
MFRTVAVIMHAPLGETAGEEMVETARGASLLDLAQNLCAAGIEEIVLVTESDSFIGEIAKFGISVTSERGPSPFHFGKTLQQLVDKHHIDGLLYFGSGSGTFLNAERIQTLAGFAQRREPGALLNNFYSCDYAAVSQPSHLFSLDLPAIDNSFGLALSDAGTSCYCLPRDLSTQYDIDTPTDVLLLAGTNTGGERISLYVNTISYCNRDIPEILKLVRSRDAQLMIIGRVNPLTWGHFERESACRSSVLSEGRGMRGYPSDKMILTNSLLIEKGAYTFFEQLSDACDGAIIDTRPLLAKKGKLPPASDRFASDLLDHPVIHDSFWREFTAAASETRIPVILGGHSLVSGGLYLLAREGWKDHQLPRRLHPDTIDWQKEQT